MAFACQTQASKVLGASYVVMYRHKPSTYHTYLFLVSYHFGLYANMCRYINLQIHKSPDLCKCFLVQDETAYSHSNEILYRGCIHSLHQKAARQQQKRVYLTGPRGCGKSIALVSLVDWARSQGWLVSPTHVQTITSINPGTDH